MGVLIYITLNYNYLNMYSATKIKHFSQQIENPAFGKIVFHTHAHTQREL